MTAIDPDLLRALLLALDGMQRSPPEPLLVVPAEMAIRLGSDGDSVSPAAVLHAMTILSDLDLIEGPGPYAGGWLFRQLTRRGRLMSEEVGSAQRWRRIKAAYGSEPD